MKEPKVVEIKKYLSSLAKMNKKYVTTERLSKVVGIYPEIINDSLSYFEPMIKMDPDFNLMELVPTLKNYIIAKEEEHTQTLTKKSPPKKISEHFDSIGDFVYRKMTNAGGLLDKNSNLSDADLRALKKLVSEEQNRRKKNK